MKRHHPSYPVAQIKKGRSTLEAEQAALDFFHRVMGEHDRRQLDYDPNTILSRSPTNHAQIVVPSRSQMPESLAPEAPNQPPLVNHENQPEPITALSSEQPLEQPLEPNPAPNLEPNTCLISPVQGGGKSDSDPASETEPCEIKDFILQETEPMRKKRKRDEHEISPVPAPVYLITNRKLRHHKGEPNLKKCQEILLSHSLPICCSVCSERGLKSKFTES
jgi:hypothetical protein